ncbi:MAG: hypothetical protein QXD11_00220 [Candidatus Micrarchaeaceae archaeon]
MDFFSIFRKKENKDTYKFPYRITTEWIPYKLYANQRSSSTLHVKIKNTTKDPLLTSLVIQLPDNLGFDTIALSRYKLEKIGEIAPDEEKDINVQVYNSANADKGEYTVTLVATAHYRNYDYVINALRKNSVVQVV